MSHNIAGTIVNNSANQEFTLVNYWFQFGGVDGDFPTSISPGAEATFSCSGMFSCSGWVQYDAGDTMLYFSFSNPAVGQNGIDIGSHTSVWDGMTGQYIGLERTFPRDSGAFLVQLLSTSGGTNNARWNVEYRELSKDQPANQTIDDVVAAYNAIPTTGSRTYYESATQPTDMSGLIESHFKGMAFYGDRMLLTHTNLAVGSDPNGKLMIAAAPEVLPIPGAGMTSATYDTQPAGALHPCSAQACGSFMAMGIQASADSKSSAIQILYIQGALANYIPSLIGIIPIPDSAVNGVGMTKEVGFDGRYIVAAVDGHVLRFYRSRRSFLDPNSTQDNIFDLIQIIEGFPDSGAGLGFVTQTDGSLFLVALNADDSGGNNVCNLYSVAPDLTSVSSIANRTMTVPGISASVSEIGVAAVFLPPPLDLVFIALMKKFGEQQLNTSFRWGKGLAINKSGGLSVFATDRNSIPWSQIPTIPAFDGNQDFSVVEWGDYTQQLP